MISTRARRRFGLLSLLAAAAFLRPPVAGMGPLLQTIGEDLHLDAATLSILGAIPVFGFGIGAFLTPRLSERLDRRQLLRGVIAVLIVAVALRSLASVPALFAGTAVIGLAIAVGNTLLPGLVRADFPSRVGLVTGLYSMVMAASAGLAAWIAVPVAERTSWQWSLASSLTIGSVALALLFLPAVHQPAHDGHPPRIAPLLTQRRALTITAYMGLQSTGFYAVLTWLPSFLTTNGFTPAAAGTALSYTGVIGIPLGLAMPVIIKWLRSIGAAALLSAFIALVGTLSLALWPTGLVWLSLTLMGLGQGLAFPIGLSAIASAGADATATTALSALAQGGGYLTAGVATFLIGAIAGWTGSWQTAMLVLAAFAAAQMLIAGRIAHGEQVTAR